MLQIVYYPHPALRRPSKPIRRVDAQLKQIIAEMFQLMYRDRGVGLAANQVGLPLRLFVMNLEGDPAKGEEWVFLNPTLSRPQGVAEKEEGCLSFPELYAPVKRPEKITVDAYNLRGEEVRLELNDFPARVVQHETDHLDGTLFVDRLSETGKMSVKETLREFEMMHEGKQSRGELPDDATIARQLDEWVQRYC